MEQKSKVIAKKNLYLILLAVAIAAVVIAVIIAIASNSKTQNFSEVSAKLSNSSTTKSTSEIPSGGDKSATTVDKSDDDSDDPGSKVPTKPTDVQIVFANPVEGGKVINNYTAASVAYNKTLGIYTGHLALDIGGEEGSNVLAVYDGVIKDIKTEYLTGTTVTIEHGDSLVTEYNSIETIDSLAVGQKVEKGEAIGQISTNNLQEKADGAHLHFAVYENGVKVDPAKYLTIGEK